MTLKALHLGTSVLSVRIHLDIRVINTLHSIQTLNETERRRWQLPPVAATWTVPAEAQRSSPVRCPAGSLRALWV